MSRFIEILATGAVAVVMLAGAAHADSRLFSARSDKNGITVTGASLNGKDLAVAGQGGGVTFFRIDNPGGSVSCTNRITFTGSGGETVTFDANICSDGAKVTVPFSTGSQAPAAAEPAKPKAAAPSQPPSTGDLPKPQAPSGGQQPQAPSGDQPKAPSGDQQKPQAPSGGQQPQAPSGGQQGQQPSGSQQPQAPSGGQQAQQPAAAQPAGDQVVTIRIEDSGGVAIDSVFMGGKPVAIRQRVDNGVQVVVAPGKDGIACSRDLGLVLSDGRRIARAVDICANNWTVSVRLVSSGGTAGQPQPSAPQPQPQQPAAGQAQPVSANAAWMFSSNRSNGSLIFGVPETDDSEFTAVCEPGSQQVTISLERSASGLQPGGTVTVNFSAGGFSQNYRATGSDVSQLSGLSNPLIRVKTDDALWQAIIHESALTIRIGSAPPYSLSLNGSAAKTRPFLDFCNPAPPPQPPVVGGSPDFGGPPPLVSPPGAFAPPAPVPGGDAIPFACDDGSYISVVFDDADGRAIVFEGGGGPPNVLRRVPSNRGARYSGHGDTLIGYAETITWSRGGSYPANCRPQ